MEEWKQIKDYQNYSVRKFNLFYQNELLNKFL